MTEEPETEGPGSGPDTSQIRFGAKIGRFVVDGELGSGGMGVVYAAHDRELDRHVALKVLRGVIDEEARMRLLREGQAMARITHPNVITVYEVGVEGRLVFLAQELLDGGSLREWLDKKRSQGEILDKFIAAGRGLAAAHNVGLVHRDFKPDNVLLGKDGRVRVSDFGLARSLNALQTMPVETHVDAMAKTTGDIMRSPMATMTRTGAVMGTPLYMSPEQHRGEAADERSDQFSFCVALYQALYGDVPFPGKTAVALADNVIGGRLQAPPKGAKVPARIRKILLRGLATDPRARYATMDALIADLLHDPAKKVRRVAIIAGVALLLAGAVVGGYVLRSREAGSGAPPAQRKIAVFGFKNLSGDKSIDWISQGLSTLLSAELAQGDSVQMVSGEDVGRAAKELGLQSMESFSKETLLRIRDRLDCNAVISGSYVIGADVTLIVNVEDIARGRNARIDVHGQSTDLPALAKEAGRKIREALAISSLTIAKGAFEVLPKNPQAARAFVDGATALRTFNFVLAKQRLMEAMKIEPDFAPGYIALAEAEEGLGDGDGAKKAARKALQYVSSLGIDQQLYVSGQAYEHLGEPEKAREHYRRLFAMSPKLEYGLALLGVETPDDFPNTVASVRKIGADDPRIDVLEGHAMIDKANPQRALELAQRAAKSTDPLVQAAAKRLEGEAQMATGELAKAADAYETSRKVYEAAGDTLHKLDLMELIAATSLERGLLDDAFAKYDSLASQRHDEKASIAHAAAAYAAALRGKVVDAEKQLKDAEATKGQDPIAIPYVDLATAAIKWARGDDEAALKASENCAARFAMALPDMSILCLAINGEIRADLGDFAAARKTYEDAVATSKNPLRSDYLQVLLSQLDLDEGGANIADEKAKTVVDTMKVVQTSAAQHGATGLEAHALVVMAEAHYAMAASQEAHDELENVDPQAIRVRVRRMITYGLAAHILGDPTQIEFAKKEADKQTCYGLVLEAKLGRAQTLAPDERKAVIDDVLRDAKARGLGRIAKLAESLAQPQ